MSVNIQLDDAVAAALTAQAAAHGVSLAAYLEQLAHRKTRQPTPRLTVDEFDALLDAEATAGPSPGGTFSRAELYSDHD